MAINPRTPPPPPAMADLGQAETNYAVPRDNTEDIRRVREAFQQNLGRDAGSDQSVIDDHLRGDVYRTGGIDAVVDAIRNSEEARRTGTDRTTSGPGGQTLYGTSPFTDRGSGTGAANWEYGGYDFGQDANNRLIGKSAKYTTAEAQRIAQAAGAADTWRTKDGAADFAKQHLQKYLEENGFEVLEIVGDKIKMRDHADRAAGREGSWVDWVIGAGGPNATLGWQVEGTQEAFGAPETYRPQGFTPTGRLAPGPVSAPQPVGAAQPLGPDAWGRAPGDPLYGQPPPYQDTPMSDLAYQELV